MTTTTLSFTAGPSYDALVRELECVFDVRGDAAVIKRALALSRIACQCQNADGVVTLIAPDGTENRISLRD